VTDEPSDSLPATAHGQVTAPTWRPGTHYRPIQSYEAEQTTFTHPHRALERKRKGRTDRSTRRVSFRPNPPPRLDDWTQQETNK